VRPSVKDSVIREVRRAETCNPFSLGDFVFVTHSFAVHRRGTRDRETDRERERERERGGWVEGGATSFDG